MDLRERLRISWNLVTNKPTKSFPSDLFYNLHFKQQVDGSVQQAIDPFGPHTISPVVRNMSESGGATSLP
ncbi:hypothetical protein EYR41_006482 [Orbilia oligospora]|uniref:Uncharacterized protein n=1 Tax=Orbilia oligospora TaxID=2813651 RepID=A0A8H2HHX2_ORBOL|nr:hypothetical protein TWF217_008363 [Orbilia oligospora]KAF3270485.1 hypothetical protein TWF128_004252 [Orbilia oligospora]KAF3298029.1 hypothetical protein TWF132_004171 [Orbilia oligospora]TGJ67349.1 hypothetical protein EYR41_006482 [Orbilia oligospora]